MPKPTMILRSGDPRPIAIREALACCGRSMTEGMDSIGRVVFSCECGKKETVHPRRDLPKLPAVTIPPEMVEMGAPRNRVCSDCGAPCRQRRCLACHAEVSRQHSRRARQNRLARSHRPTLRDGGNAA